MSNSNIDYVKEYIAYSDTYPNATWDDFFDYVNLPIKQRTDFLIGLIVMQAQGE